jgi:hypothetical protein
MLLKREFIGEALGTFVLVLFGCGSVAGSVLFESQQGLMQVGLAWGIDHLPRGPIDSSWAKPRTRPWAPSSGLAHGMG